MIWQRKKQAWKYANMRNRTKLLNDVQSLYSLIFCGSPRMSWSNITAKRNGLSRPNRTIQGQIGPNTGVESSINFLDWIDFEVSQRLGF